VLHWPSAEQHLQSARLVSGKEGPWKKKYCSVRNKTEAVESISMKISSLVITRNSVVPFQQIDLLNNNGRNNNHNNMKNILDVSQQNRLMLRNLIGYIMLFNFRVYNNNQLILAPFSIFNAILIIDPEEM